MVDLFQAKGHRVKLTAGLTRVLHLPRRHWTNEEAEDLSTQLTEVLRTEWGTMSLRPIQAVGLYEIGIHGGLFGPMRVGAGKTLTSLLAPAVGFCDRPLLLVPAKLIGKTERDQKELGRHWLLPPFIRVMSYEWLGRVQAAEALESYRPDLIILDECHKLKNLKAAVTRRVKRYFTAYPDTKCVAMSGTVTKRSLKDYAHIIQWCLKDNRPLPEKYVEVELWADALDERKGQTRRAHPGALIQLCNQEEKKLWVGGDYRRAARQAYRRRLVDTPSVVATRETPIDASLRVEAVEVDVGAPTEEAFRGLRKDWETPDGWPISDGIGMFRHARELGLGFYYVWDPRPPAYWLVARSEWCSYVRKTIGRSRSLDSELAVANAVRLGAITDGIGPKLLEEWQAVRKDFEPNTVPRWIDDSVIDHCAEWMDRNVGIVWTEHTYFARRLSEIAKVPYYGRKGLNADKVAIEDHDPKRPLIASVQSNGEGRNLQAYNQNLITSFPPNGAIVEQLLGRTHRDGQLADEVVAQVVVTCVEHVAAIWQAKRDCHYVYDSTGSPQKLLVAAIDAPTADDLALGKTGPRWHK